jgi:Delta24-sterol reductase
VDVSGMTNILAVDTATKMATVEPNVPMDVLVKATLPHGLLPPVIPEFPGITVGGGFAGTAGESSSFKFGFLDTIVERIEVVCADGEVVTADKNINEDLFYGMAGTLGTLGVLTLLHVRLIPAKSHVQLTYHQVSSFTRACSKIENVLKHEAEYDFVDGIMYSKTKGAIITGIFLDAPSKESVVRFTRRRDPWFYLHAEKAVSQGTPEKPTVEYVPVIDYLFRYDRGGFWVGKFAFDYFHLPFCFLLRYVLDQFLHTRVMYHSLHASGLAEKYIIQDVAIPMPAAAAFLKSVNEEFNIYPLWLCPLKFGRMGLKHKHMNPEAHPVLLNVGIWSPGPEDAKARESANRSIEAKVMEMDGTKWLYAQTYYTEDEFWNIYEKAPYDALREKYRATHLPDVYAKVKKLPPTPEPKGATRKAKRRIGGFWVFPGLYGLIRTRFEKDYILKRDEKRTQKS